MRISTQLYCSKISYGGKAKQDVELYLQEDIVKTVKQDHVFLGIDIWHANENAIVKDL